MAAPISYGEVRRRAEPFHAMLVAWVIGLALMSGAGGAGRGRAHPGTTVPTELLKKKWHDVEVTTPVPADNLRCGSVVALEVQVAQDRQRLD